MAVRVGRRVWGAVMKWLRAPECQYTVRTHVSKGFLCYDVANAMLTLFSMNLQVGIMTINDLRKA